MRPRRSGSRSPPAGASREGRWRVGGRLSATGRQAEARLLEYPASPSRRHSAHRRGRAARERTPSPSFGRLAAFIGEDQLGAERRVVYPAESVSEKLGKADFFLTHEPALREPP